MSDVDEHYWIRGPVDRLAIARGYYFDEAEGERVIRFIEKICRLSQGKWSGKPMILLDWQKDFLMRLFGWRQADGRRRFRRFYLEVSKKNGKSALLSALCLYFVLADRYVAPDGSTVKDGAPEVHINACTREQATIIYREASRMVAASPGLSRRLKVLGNAKRILDPEANGLVQANSADVAGSDGKNASVVIFDELHRQPNRDMWDVWEYAGAARDQPLLGSITTAGETEDGVWYEQRKYSEDVNAGLIDDITHLGVVYRAMPDDDLDDPATWRKANPSLGVTIDEAAFEREYREAKSNPHKWANFLRLRLNIVIRSDKAFFDLAAWDACQGKIAPVDGREWFGGLDLSQNQDLTAFMKLVLPEDEDGPYDVVPKFWLPEENINRLESQHQLPYRAWAEAGLITLTPGKVIDYEFIRREINEAASEGECKGLYVDPYNAAKLAMELKDQDGLPVEYVRQGYLSLSGPTKELLRLILSGRIRHGGHPILRNHVANAIAEQDAAGNVKLSKSKSKSKIDGAAALTNSVAGLLSGQLEDEEVSEDGGAYWL